MIGGSMRLSMSPHAADGGSSSVDRPAAGDGGERSGTDAAASAASRTAAGKIARSLVGDGAAQELESLSGGHGRRQGPPVDAPGVPKPYTVPPGWKAPTLGEQFRYVSPSTLQCRPGCRIAPAVPQNCSCACLGVEGASFQRCVAMRKGRMRCADDAL